MDCNFIFDSIIEGIAIGIVVAVLLSAYDLSRRWRRKREQITFIKNLLSVNFRNINNATELRNTPGNGVRITIYESLLRDFRTISELRTSELGHAHLFDLQKILRDVESFMLLTNIGSQFGMNQPNGMEFYNVQFFDKLQKLHWLKWSK